MGLPLGDLPTELYFIRNAYADIRAVSSLEPYSVTDGNCLTDCKGAVICNDELPKYFRPIPKVFDDAIYGAKCALELGNKREELETSGLLDRIVKEAA